MDSRDSRCYRSRGGCEKGFRSSFHDATCGYLVPYSNDAYHGNVARFDLATFRVVQGLDVAAADAILKGFIDGFHDCTYGCVVPYYNGAYSGKVARFDSATFRVVQVLDVSASDASPEGFRGGF